MRRLIAFVVLLAGSSLAVFPLHAEEKVVVVHHRRHHRRHHHVVVVEHR